MLRGRDHIVRGFHPDQGEPLLSGKVSQVGAECYHWGTDTRIPLSTHEGVTHTYQTGGRGSPWSFQGTLRVDWGSSAPTCPSPGSVYDSVLAEISLPLGFVRSVASPGDELLKRRCLRWKVLRGFPLISSSPLATPMVSCLAY